jgi:hypothetical protein
MAEPNLPPARYEPADVTFRFLAWGAVLVLSVLLLSCFGTIWMYPGLVQDRRLTGSPPVFPAPRLQDDPNADLLRFEASEHARLNSLGWVDKAHGIVHIPIDEAMRRIATQGIPDWPAPAGGTH